MRKYVSRWSGSFQVPARMMRWLEEMLAGEGYRVQAVAVAALAMRVWCSPEHIGKPFPLSRGEVAEKLGLKDWETRKAIELLVKVGFINRQNGAGKPRRTAKGIRRPPTLYRLCVAVLSYFRRLLAKRSQSPAPVTNPSDENRSSPEGIITGEVTPPPSRSLGEDTRTPPSGHVADHRLGSMTGGFRPPAGSR